jgi:hypothetical protein
MYAYICRVWAKVYELKYIFESFIAMKCLAVIAEFSNF